MLLPEPVDCFEHRVALKILYLILRQSGIPVAVGVFNPFDDLKRQRIRIYQPSVLKSCGELLRLEFERKVRLR